MSLVQKNILIVGLGLIGGSIARDIKSISPQTKVWAFDKSSAAITYARKQGWVDFKAKETDFKSMDLIVLATPVSCLIEQLSWVAGLVPSKTLVIDVGSTKKVVVKQASQFFPQGNFVGSHPMAGSEKSSVKAAVQNLFQDKTCLVVPARTSKKVMIQKTMQFWKSLGAKCLTVPAADHDATVAAVSHLPHLMAFSLMHSVGNQFPHSVIKKVSGRSFKSYTRIAGSDPKMWMDIFLDNKKEVAKQFRNFEKEFHKLAKWIESEDDQKIFDYIETSRKLWNKT